MAFGLKLPVLFGDVYLCSSLASDLAGLDGAMLHFIDAPVPAASAQEGAEALLEKLYYWYITLQREVNLPVYGPCSFQIQSGRESTESVSHFKMAIPYANLQAAQATLRWVVAAFNIFLAHGRLPEKHQESLRAGVTIVRKNLRARGLVGTNAIHFLDAAYEHGIPVTRILNNVCCFGLGEKSRWMTSSATDEDSAIGVRIARHKADSAAVLGAFGLPVPEHTLVLDEEDAVRVARIAGYPLVVKPADLDQGMGVSAGLLNEKSLRSAFRTAREHSESILVERHYEGKDYRFTVMGQRVIKVMCRQAGGVIGDGKSTVADLLLQVQAREEHQRALRLTGKMRLDFDAEALELLAEQGLERTGVPEANQVVPLRRKSNISTGGSHRLIALDTIHPDNCELAVRAAKVLGLNIAGIDLIMADAARPWHETGAIICEVNAEPQIGFRDTPEIYAEILHDLLQGDGTIPLHLLVVAKGQCTAGVEAYRELAGTLACNSISTYDGVWIDDIQCVWRPKHSFASARALLIDKDVRSALIVMSATDILRFGLPAARFTSIDMTDLQEVTKIDEETADRGSLAELGELLQLHSDNILGQSAAQR